jgi:acyl carrier protein
MSTPHTEIVKNVRDVIAEQLGIHYDEVSLEKRFMTDLGADSLDLCELAMAVEEVFDIEIMDEDWERVMDSPIEKIVELV